MNPLFVLGIFTLGAGAGGLCVWVQQRGIRSRFRKEITDQLDKALFDPIRRKKNPSVHGRISTVVPFARHRRNDISNVIKGDSKRHVKS